MQLSIKDFRCFHDVQGIPIRPINILVGENSTGKSSLLAAMRFLCDLLRREGNASFNKDPFFLGSYEQIAHYRGGRFGRAKEFSFTVQGQLDATRVAKRLFTRMNLEVEYETPSAYELNVRFVNNRSEPATSLIDFHCGHFSISVHFSGDQIKATLNTPSQPKEEIKDRFIPRNRDTLITGVSYLDFILRDLRYMDTRAGANFLTDPAIQKRATERLWLNELFHTATSDLSSDVYASAPVRSKPERTYNPGEANPAPSGEHIPFVLAQIKAFDRDLWTEIAKTLSAFGKASGLFEDVNIRRLTHTEGGPFQLVVTLSGARSNIMDVGYGVSQALPIVADLARAKRRTLFLLQQPEVHLHPRAQAELATFFAQMVQSKKHTLFIETHSDFLIDRMRIEAREAKHIKPDDLSILFFEKVDHDVVVHPISVDELGNVRGAPASYREFFIREEFRSLGVSL